MHVLDLRRSHLGMQTWHRLGVALAHHTRSDSFDQLPAAAWSKIRLALCHLQQHVLRYKVSHVLYALLSCLSPTAQGCRVGRLWGRLLWRQPGVSRQSPQPVGGYQHAHTHTVQRPGISQAPAHPVSVTDLTGLLALQQQPSLSQAHESSYALKL